MPAKKTKRTGYAPQSQLDLEETKRLEAARTKKAVARDGKTKKLGALGAAAKVLSSTKKPLTARELIDAMKARKLWCSPGGATPHATLYAAIVREIGTKGRKSRFKKTERGKFTVKG